METELEIKFLNINVKKFRAKLEKIGARCITANRLMKRYLFSDLNSNNFQINTKWLRLRHEGNVTKLCLKQSKGVGIEMVKEIEIEVSDFDKTKELLLEAGFSVNSYQETKRESWEFEGTKIDIDTWPWIPTFVEMEGMSEVQMRSLATDLDLNWDLGVYGAVANVYKNYFSIEDDEINLHPNIVFSSVPKDLLSKKKS